MKNKKRILALAMVGIMTLSIGTSSFASTPTLHHQENSGFSLISTVENYITPFGLRRPSTDNVVNLNEKALNFYGEASDSPLYTDNNFKGKSTVAYEIKNNSDKQLTVNLYKANKFFKIKSIKVSGRHTQYGWFEKLDKDTLYHLEFKAPSNFTGKVY